MRKAVLTILLASVVAVPVMFAQGKGGGHNGANRVAHQVKYLTTMLDLTTDQQTQLTTVFTNANTANRPLFEAMRTAHQQFQTDKESGSGNLTADAEAVSKAQSQLMVNNANTDTQVKGILSATQYTKYETLHGHGGGGGWGGGHGHGGPGGPGGPGGAAGPGPGGPQ